VEVEVLSGAAELAIRRELRDFCQGVLCAPVLSCLKAERNPSINWIVCQRAGCSYRAVWWSEMFNPLFVKFDFSLILDFRGAIGHHQISPKCSVARLVSELDWEHHTYGWIIKPFISVRLTVASFLRVPLKVRSIEIWIDLTPLALVGWDIPALWLDVNSKLYNKHGSTSEPACFILNRFTDL